MEITPEMRKKATEMFKKGRTERQQWKSRLRGVEADILGVHTRELPMLKEAWEEGGGRFYEHPSYEGRLLQRLLATSPGDALEESENAA